MKFFEKCLGGTKKIQQLDPKFYLFQYFEFVRNIDISENLSKNNFSENIFKTYASSLSFDSTGLKISITAWLNSY